MKVAAGPHLLRLESVAPVHLGSTAGETMLDRPCQTDSIWGLPFVPDSALKGVWAGARGNAFGAESENPGREDVFGSPDRGGKRGKPAPLTVGNGELLCFPVPVKDGPPAWVFPALSVARLLRLDPEATQSKTFPWTIGQIESSSQPLVFASPELPRSEALSGFLPVIGASAMDEAASLKAELLHYTGGSVPEDATFLLVANREARRLWLAASDRRTLTALTNDRTVREGSLRNVELIPPGTIFLSLLTCDRDLDVPWPGLLQMGAWEGLGFGWMKPVLVSGRASAPGKTETSSRRAARVPNEPDVMEEMHQAVASLKDEPDELRKSIKSVVGNFGPRAQFSGLEAALAFELAKAKPMNARPSKEARAHRWLLSALLFSARSPRENEPMPDAVTWLEEDPFQASWISAHRDQLFLRWQWLRRFVEYGIEI